MSGIRFYWGRRVIAGGFLTTVFYSWYFLWIAKNLSFSTLRCIVFAQLRGLDKSKKFNIKLHVPWWILDLDLKFSYSHDHYYNGHMSIIVDKQLTLAGYNRAAMRQLCLQKMASKLRLWTSSLVGIICWTNAVLYLLFGGFHGHCVINTFWCLDIFVVQPHTFMLAGFKL